MDLFFVGGGLRLYSVYHRNSLQVTQLERGQSGSDGAQVACCLKPLCGDTLVICELHPVLGPADLRSAAGGLGSLLALPLPRPPDTPSQLITCRQTLQGGRRPGGPQVALRNHSTHIPPGLPVT